MNRFFLPLGLCVCSLVVSACGYKGALYLPKTGDKNTFGPVQTGLGIGRAASDAAQSVSETQGARP